MSPEFEIARQWAAKAQNDLLNADNNLASSNVPSDTVCFHCQQAAEKLLKAALAANGVPPPRTHILLVLMDAIAPLLPSVENLREDLVILTPYAVSARYPDDETDMPTLEDAREARQCAERVRVWLKGELPDLHPKQ
jgi:HEPN domain-containing protein